jgi:hypothetical protein
VNDPARHASCTVCGVHERLFHHGLCSACALVRQLTQLLGGNTGTVRPTLVPVLDCLKDSSDPFRTLLWVRSPSTRHVLTSLATARGPLSHRQLDALEPPLVVKRLRAALVVAGALPPRDERLVALENWIRTALRDVAEPERQALTGFATWHHLRRLRGQKKPVSSGQATVVRRQVTAGIRLIDWLRGHGCTLTTATQHHVDAWIDQGSYLIVHARTFVDWSVRRGYAHRIELPARKPGEPRHFAEHDARWALVRRLLQDDNIPTARRFAGLLVLLYAQPVSRLVDLPVDRVTHTDKGVTLQLGREPLELPPPLDALAAELAQRRHGRCALGPSDTSPWLFPGALPGRPISTQMLARQLTNLGITVRSARNTALMELAAELPAVVCSRLLGLSNDAAARWTRTSGAHHAAYAAELTRR